MTTPFEKFIERQRELAGKATSAPWERLTSGNLITRSGYVTHEWNNGTKGTTDIICKPSIEHNVGIDDENNYLFIANARNTAEIQLQMLQLMWNALFTMNSGSEAHIVYEKIQLLAEKALNE